MGLACLMNEREEEINNEGSVVKKRSETWQPSFFNGRQSAKEEAVDTC